MAPRPAKSPSPPRRLLATPAAGASADLPAHVADSIREHHLLEPGQQILAAVSGGVDSMVLLHVLQDLSATERWRIVVAHFNHCLRGRASAADERLVRSTARRLRLPVVVGRADVRGHARRKNLSLEMAARELRHEFLARQAGRRRIPAVALAHHADDQVELFFLRLFRGSGGQGLGGMSWSAPSPAGARVKLIRPFLDIPKSLLQTYAHSHQIKFREDASNACLDMQRNRVRHQLLPLLRKEYQPALGKGVLRVMEILSAEADYVTANAREWLRAPHARPFDRLPLAIQRRSLQLQLQQLGIPPEFDLIEQLRGHAGKPVMVGSAAKAIGRKRRRVPNTMTRDSLGILRRGRPVSLSFRKRSIEVSLASASGSIQFAGLQLSWTKDARPAHVPPRPSPGQECFDADKVGNTVTLRHWRAGDRFQPIGMKRPVKLQDFLTNAKVPARQRRQLVLAATGNGEILWVEGMRISERFKLETQTKHCLNWTWERLQS